MSVAHLIARLSAGTANFKPVGRGGLPEFTNADIALAVGRISNPAAQLLVLMKYAGQDAPAVVQETVRLLTAQVITRWATPERWGVPRGKGDSNDQTGRQRLEARTEALCKHTFGFIASEIVRRGSTMDTGLYNGFFCTISEYLITGKVAK